MEDVISVHPGEVLAPLRYTFDEAPDRPQRVFPQGHSDPSGASVTINGVLHKETTPFVLELDTAEVGSGSRRGTSEVRRKWLIVLRPAPALNEKTFELKKAG